MEFRKSLSRQIAETLIRLLPFWVPMTFAGAQEFRLAPPRITFENDCRLFEKSATIRCAFDLQGSVLHFTLDGTNPTRRSPVYRAPIVLRESAVVKVMAEHPDFRDSDPASVSFYKISPLPLDSILLAHPPSPHYPGKGASTLTDCRLGGADIHDGSWIGFEGEPAELTLKLKGKHRVSRLRIGALISKGAWIFPPRSVEVTGSSDGLKYFPLAQKTLIAPKEALPDDGPIFYTLALPHKKCRQIRVVVHPFGALPEGHPGAGKPAWLFLDEIIVE